MGKSFEILIEDTGLVGRIEFGGKVTLGHVSGVPNKKLIAKSSLFLKVLAGDILFENLYTGYEAEWERYPQDAYNRDIVMFIVMYSYVFKNRLCKMYRD